MTDEVLFSQDGHLGLITLNRPSALNALTLNMILAMQKQLAAWKQDKSIKAIILHAAPSNAFCAGGDVRWLYNAGKAQDEQQMSFFWHEYRLNHFIHHLGKPYIALMDGITMGGGVGVGLHGSHPVASERFVFAMPETSIGFFPDIGASYLLNRCPGQLGVYLGLTGNRLSAEEACAASLVKQVINADQFPALIHKLRGMDLSGNAHEQVDDCLVTFANDCGGHINQQALIDSCFAHDSVEEIIESLNHSKIEGATTLGELLAKKAPLSLKVTLAQLDKTKGLSLAECLKIDYDVVGHFMRDSDFYEGVRALLIDKDKNPHWQPSSLESVSDSMVVNYFERTEGGLELID